MENMQKRNGEKMTTIQEIITKGQKKRHENHVKAGKNIKEKWKQEIIKDERNKTLKEIFKITSETKAMSWGNEWWISLKQFQDKLKELGEKE